MIQNEVSNDLKSTNCTLAGTFRGIKKTDWLLHSIDMLKLAYAEISRIMYRNIRVNQPKIVFIVLKNPFNLAPESFMVYSETNTLLNCNFKVQTCLQYCFVISSLHINTFN